VVLACYELAHFYHVDPQVFLVKTMSELSRSRYWTGRLTQRIREAQEAADSDG
jgi:hypothetical protein